MPGHIPPGGILGRLFCKYLQTCFLNSFFVSVFNAHRKKRELFRYSPRHGNGRAQVFITCVSFTNSSPITLNAGVVCLGRGVVCYLRGMYLPLLTACLSSICVQVHITVYWRVPLSSPLPRNGTAKVQTYLETTKQKTKKVYFINNLQQISMILPKFIHILSTKLAKCAYIGTNFHLYGVITCVHYI